MMTERTHSVLGIMWIVHMLTLVTLAHKLVNSEKRVCVPGWFGSACQYKCHCNRRNCDDDGHCFAGSSCKKGWFGPACQYEDLVPRGTVTTNQETIIPELTDNDSSTCLPDIFLQSVSVTWNTPYPFTWIRIQVEDPSLLHKIMIQVSQSSTTPQLEDCPSPLRNFSVAEDVLDIQCQLNTAVQQVVLTGEGVQSLCSLHISGGRNVALRQSTSQSTTLVSSNVSSRSDNAVDGNCNGNWKNGSCIHTDFGDKSPTWKVRFSRPVIVNRIVLYNRLDTNNTKFPNSYKENLKGFRLKTNNKYGTEVFSYTDNQPTALDVYTVTSAAAKQPILELQIQTNNNVLSLCEVEVYGDTDCEPGYYGRECEHACNCAVKNEACLVSTGGCLSGCAPGYHGEGCVEPCDAGQHGHDCKVKCSQFCKVNPEKNSSSCHHVDGRCLHGCQIGYKEPLCLSPCPKLTFGENCKKRCGPTCADDGSCHHVTGECLRGCKDGYTGDMCTEKCLSDTYGKNCNSSCSPFCIKDDDEPQVSSCHHVNGNCLYGCQSGYEGLHCNLVHNTKEYTSLGSGIIAGIAIGSAVFICITSILIWIVLRKHRKIRKLRVSVNSSPDYDNAPSLRHDYEPVYSEADDSLPKKDFSMKDFSPADTPSDRKGSINDDSALYEGIEKDNYDVMKYDITEGKGE